MTKIIDLTKEAKEEKVLKPIEFARYININGDQTTAQTAPSRFEFIELICRKYENEYDLMFAYNLPRNSGSLYLGYINDGIV